VNWLPRLAVPATTGRRTKWLRVFAAAVVVAVVGIGVVGTGKSRVGWKKVVAVFDQQRPGCKPNEPPPRSKKSASDP